MSDHGTITIRELGGGDAASVIEAGHLFDRTPTEALTTRFLGESNHHLLIADWSGVPAGFVTGVEVSHPDKGTEMMLYELGVDEGFRQRGIGRALAVALKDLAARRGCVGMWVPIEPDNEAAVATYRSAGAARPEPAAIMWWELDTR